MKKILTVMLSLAGLAAAHPGHGASGFVAGLAHPLTGIDHLLALVATGVWAFRAGGLARRIVPPLFLFAMAAGFLLSWTGSVRPGPETWTIAGCIGLVAAALLGGRIPLVLPSALVAALLHGMAHGGEAPSGSSGTDFLAGFLISAAGLQLTGSLLAFGCRYALLKASAPTGRSPVARVMPESV